MKKQDLFLKGLDYRIRNLNEVLDSKVGDKLPTRLRIQFQDEIDTTEAIRALYVKTRKKAKK